MNVVSDIVVLGLMNGLVENSYGELIIFLHVLKPQKFISITFSPINSNQSLTLLKLKINKNHSK